MNKKTNNAEEKRADKRNQHNVNNHLTKNNKGGKKEIKEKRKEPTLPKQNIKKKQP